MKLDAFAKIRPTKLNFYLTFMTERGFKPEQLLTGTNLTQELLQDSHMLVEIPDYIRLVSNMIRLRGSPILAFELGESLRPGDLGILGHAFSACENAPESIALWQKYSQLFFGNLITVEQSNDGELYWFEYKPQVKLLPHLQQFFMEEKLNIEVHLFRHFNDCTVKNRYFSFTYPKPDYADLYNQLLGVNVRFNAPKNLYAVSIEDEYFSSQFPRADKETLAVCKAYLDNLTNVAYSHTTTSSKLRLLIRENFPKILSVKEAAREFNYSERIFTRLLEKEQTSYQKELSKVREETTKNYLATTSLTIEEIAHLLGFIDAGSLRRSFKHWTGKTITQFKESMEKHQ